MHNYNQGGQSMSETTTTTNNNIPVHAVAEISVDPNFTTAFLTVSAPQNGGLDITMDKIKAAINEKNISFGIFEDSLQSVVDDRRYDENICIARWKPPVDGIDGEVKYHFDKSTVIAPTEDEHGTVDYKNLGLVKNTLTGTVIADISMPTEGEPGKDICGKVVRQHIGVPARVTIGKGTALTEDGTQIIASVDGNLCFANGAFCVNEELLIKGDVDVASGNIDFIGNVIIKGNVSEGYSVTSKKNITINGTATGATLTADGDITIKNGIFNSEVVCKGNIRMGFCENSNVRCDNNVEAQSFVGGEVYAGKEIMATGKGVMMGGKYTALENIEAATFGSEGYAKTVITVGNNAVLTEEKDELVRKNEVLEDKFDQLGKILTSLTELAKAGKLSPEREQMKVEAMKSRFQIQGEMKRNQLRITEIDRTLEMKQNLSVSCRKEFLPGVLIRINSFVYTVNVAQSRSRACIGPEGIVFMPL